MYLTLTIKFMKLPNQTAILHRSQIYQLLTHIIDDSLLSKSLIFKGGTCATLLGYLDRFSVDLDFDQINPNNTPNIKKSLETIFKKLDLTIKNQSVKTVQYQLKYPAESLHRNTLKLDAVAQALDMDIYTPQYLADIDRYMTCQTIETMFAHKLVALTDRYKKHGSIAGRDIYDLRYFFLHGYSYHEAIITERTGKTAQAYLVELKTFISTKVSQATIDQDINTLLTPHQFQKIRKTLKPELLLLLNEQIQTIKQ